MTVLSKVRDKISKQKIQQAWVSQQIKEVESDPSEEQVIDEHGQVLASRHWKCNARSCIYQHYRGNCTKLAIKVEAKDRSKLTYQKQHACLKHYSIKNEDNNYCHNYFKVHKKLPEGSFLNLTTQEKEPNLTPSIVTEPQPLSSTSSLQIEGKTHYKTFFWSKYGMLLNRDASLNFYEKS